jgi:hypothetical protein
MAIVPTPTQTELNTIVTNLRTGAAPPVLANDGSGPSMAKPPHPHPSGWPPSAVYK